MSRPSLTRPRVARFGGGLFFLYQCRGGLHPRRSRIRFVWRALFFPHRRRHTLEWRTAPLRSLRRLGAPSPAFPC